MHEQLLHAAIGGELGDKAHGWVHTHAIELDHVRVAAHMLKHRRLRQEVLLRATILRNTHTSTQRPSDVTTGAPVSPDCVHCTWTYNFLTATSAPRKCPLNTLPKLPPPTGVASSSSSSNCTMRMDSD